MSIPRDLLVLALYPNARGFAYVVFEGSQSPVEWGISEVLHREGRLKMSMRRLAALFARYGPDILVLRATGNMAKASSGIIEAAEALARVRGIQTHFLSRKEIRQTFSYLGSLSRYAIAVGIAQKIPIFAPLLPPSRKIWNGEDRRMGLFDAASLAMAFFTLRMPEAESQSAIREQSRQRFGRSRGAIERQRRLPL